MSVRASAWMKLPPTIATFSRAAGKSAQMVLDQEIDGVKGGEEKQREERLVEEHGPSVSAPKKFVRRSRS
jgi:hypothetical protein